MMFTFATTAPTMRDSGKHGGYRTVVCKMGKCDTMDRAILERLLGGSSFKGTNEQQSLGWWKRM